jgi:hypothetical protein
MYKQASQSGSGPESAGASGAAAGSGGDDVIDAEYVDVDDKK